MKKIYLLIVVALAIGSSATAQCTGLYAADVFTTVATTTAIPYGSNLDYTGATTNLTLDFYEGSGDPSTARPLIIWAHGGSFYSGTSADPDVVSLSQHFAKKGYACASINYRIGVSPFDSVGFVQAVVRAVQDMKAAIRFFYKDKLTTNTYKIDTNNIFIGGSSAGAFVALHTAYLDRTCEINPYVPQNVLDSLGGMDGYSGNQCYSQKVNGVINLCGALGVYGWLEAGNLPFCSMHGTVDGTVNYSRGPVLPSLPIHILDADGSRMLNAQAIAVGVQNNFYTWYGADHIPYIQGGTTATQLAYMDTTVNFVRDYLLQRMNISCPVLQVADAPFGSATLYSYTVCVGNSPLNCNSAVGIKTISNNLMLEVYPNPSNDKIKIVFENSIVNHSIQITDISGRIIKSYSSNQSEITIEKGDLNAGMYLLKVSNAQGESSLQKIMFY